MRLVRTFVPNSISRNSLCYGRKIFASLSKRKLKWSNEFRTCSPSFDLIDMRSTSSLTVSLRHWARPGSLLFCTSCCASRKSLSVDAAAPRLDFLLLLCLKSGWLTSYFDLFSCRYTFRMAFAFSYFKPSRFAASLIDIFFSDIDIISAYLCSSDTFW